MTMMKNGSCAPVVTNETCVDAERPAPSVDDATRLLECYCAAYLQSSSNTSPQPGVVLVTRLPWLLPFTSTIAAPDDMRNVKHASAKYQMVVRRVLASIADAALARQRRLVRKYGLEDLEARHRPKSSMDDDASGDRQNDKDNGGDVAVVAGSHHPSPPLPPPRDSTRFDALVDCELGMTNGGGGGSGVLRRQRFCLCCALFSRVVSHSQ